jgi:hypothetical protein
VRVTPRFHRRAVAPGSQRHKEPEQFDSLSFAPGEEMQVDYGEGAPTRVPGTERWRKPRLFVATLRYSRRSFRRQTLAYAQLDRTSVSKLCGRTWLEGRSGPGTVHNWGLRITLQS